MEQGPLGAVRGDHQRSLVLDSFLTAREPASSGSLGNLAGGLVAHLRPYWLHLYLLVYTPLVLFADSRVAAGWQQAGLGLLTLLLLFLCTRRIAPAARRQVWLCVLVATGFEVLGSLVWGVYLDSSHDLVLASDMGSGLWIVRPKGLNHF